MSVTFWLPIILAFIAGIPATLAVIYARRSSKKVLSVERKVDEIHVMVNSNLAKALAEITALRAVIEDHNMTPPATVAAPVAPAATAVVVKPRVL
jgi:hypothetical protein